MVLRTEPQVSADALAGARALDIHGDIIAAGVALEDYLARYAAGHCEYIEGYVIQLSPTQLRHSLILQYLLILLRSYFETTQHGRVILQPFVMRLPAFPNRRREPDLFVVLNDNPHPLTPTYMDGPADIVIEIISEESDIRDRGEKFTEYEQGGVPEYWLIDPLRDQAMFYRQASDHGYRLQALDADECYTTPALPGLKVHVPTLWGDPLPTIFETLEAVKAMLTAAE
ncbi:MAG: Uma2 family endonuclease [bacterium]|nr:Uma2 family endonuclease [bacterium]